MTLDQMTMFIAVAEAGTFSAAAKTLHISQPSISIAIKNLEDELELLLLDRSTYRPTLTAEGQEIYRCAKHLVALSKEITTTAQHLAHGEEKRITIVLDIVAPLPDILSVLRRYFSDVTCKIELSFCVLGRGIDDVVKNFADLYVGPVFAEVEEVSPQFHSHYHMVPVLGRAHPDSVLTLDVLRRRIAQIPRVILRSGNEQNDARSPSAIANESADIFVEDYLIKRETIASGLGWGRLPLWNIEQELKSGSLIDLRHIFPLMKITGDIFVVPKAKHRGKHLNAVVALLAQAGGKKPS